MPSANDSYGEGYPNDDAWKSTMMRRNRRFLPGLNNRIRAGVPILLVLVALSIILPAAMSSVRVALICASALVLATTALIVGLERTGSGLLILAFGTAPLNDLRPIGPLPFLELSDAFFVTGFLLLAPRFARTTLRLPSAFLVGGVGLLTVGTLSALATDQPGSNLGYMVDVAQGVVLLLVLLAWWEPGLRTTIAAVIAYMLGNAANVVAALFEDPVVEDRYAGLTTHPNALGLCQALGLALAPFLLEALPRRYRWIVAISAVVAVYGIWISGSRAALACAVAMTLLYPLFKRSIPVAVAVAALCVPAIVVVDRVARNPDPSNLLGRLLGAGSASGSNAERIAGAQLGLDQFYSHPVLGDGWLTVWGAHNVYLQIAAAIGALGLTCYLILLAPIIRPLIAVPPPYGLLAAPGLIAAMVGVVDPALGSRYIWCVVALALSAERLAALAGADSLPKPLPERARDRYGTVTRLG